ncbi:ABC transporter ATP-binding protein [Peribacillus muralis]|uniref:ABC transporter ATP-binding protein n=1 Tax=Peribacillus muralis TaxID=264697 RepID=UPI001F4DC70B|nr:ABC transporter ATP-binding protein [Peribacillus muralis]MCK1992725.1 ABC transporter ATP-binding protein [Peribacillus muralis]MCK2013280.1 ABC transporter ATP-binding protein [Peribacillus muralis]
MIEIKQMSKLYEGKEAIKNVTLAIEKGTIFGLLGSNGAGKTTLLKILSGNLIQDTGEVLIDSSPVFENREVKNRCFFLPDSPYFLANYTILQMAVFFRCVYREWNEERFHQLQEVFPIPFQYRINKLSKGMQRQVAFWLALSTMPEVLILDEPFDGLDPVMRKNVRQLLIQDVTERDMTILISSHNLREIEDIADHVGILHNGELVIQKDLSDLKADLHKVQIAFKDKIPHGIYRGIQILDKQRQGSVIVCIVKGKEAMIEAHFNQFQPDIFDMLPLSLEEIFIYEMGDIGYVIQNDLA